MNKLSLKQFLHQARDKLSQHAIQLIVVGNESADLDSIISAQMLAYVYTCQDGKAAIPLINCSRQDYRLRTESYGFLKRYDIDANDLIFIEDIPADLLQSPGRLKVNVVDQNQLADNLSDWNRNVTAILDHHQDLGCYPQADPRIFSVVGSCSTLVADYILNLSKGDISPEIASLLLAPILLDTINLDPSQNRVTAKDVEVASQLIKISDENPDKLYQDLQAMKVDVSGLSSAELLRKDYKQWNSEFCNYGISSVPLSLQQWFAQDPLVGLAVADFMRSNQLTLLIIMSVYVADEFKREMVICSEQEQHVISLEKIFNETGLQLHESNKCIDLSYFYKVYHQGNASYSRKKVQPMIAGFIEQL